MERTTGLMTASSNRWSGRRPARPPGRRRVLWSAAVAGLLLVSTLTGAPALRAATAAAAFPGCAPPPAPGVSISVVVGTVACQELTTHLLGDGIPAPFEYYVPPECAPALAVRCPVIYLLHGFGGDFTELLGHPGAPAAGAGAPAWVAALTTRPPQGSEASSWTNYDPAGWQAASHLGIILVAPHGQTLPGGYGPAPGMDSYWVDWNPRYASGGDQQRYGTPTPRFADFLVSELPDFVEDQLPAGSGREWRALAGVSLGGYGAYANGLRHPDFWSVVMSVSGAHNFLFTPAPQPGAVTLPAGVAPPVPVSYSPLPPATGALPAGAAPSQVGTFQTALTALGDPVADQAYFRGNMPTDLAANARAYAGSDQVLGIDGFVNDTVPRRPEDLGSTPFEDLVFPMNMDMEEAYAAQGVENTFAVHQGVHSDVYRNAWYRGLEEFAYARLRHADGGGSPEAVVSSFDYRTISTGFDIWGWRFSVARRPVEFLNLRSVGCAGLTLQGTGTVTVTVPARCGTGLAGRRTFEVDLGPPQPVGDPAALGATPAYGRTETVTLTCLRPTGTACRAS